MINKNQLTQCGKLVFLNSYFPLVNYLKYYIIDYITPIIHNCSLYSGITYSHKGESFVKKVIFHAALISAILLLILPNRFLQYSCPIRSLYNIPCPTCGMSRALRALLSGNIMQSLEYNPALIPMIALLLFGIHKDKIPMVSKDKTIILIIGAGVIFCIYIIRLSFFVIQ